jgi:hypothetical protein
MPSSPSSNRPWLRLLISVLLMVIFVGGLLTQVRLHDLREVGRKLDPGWVLLSVFWYALLPIVRAWRLSALLNRPFAARGAGWKPAGPTGSTDVAPAEPCGTDSPAVSAAPREPPRLPLWRLVFISAVQNYLIFILPFRAGEVSFIVLLGRERAVGASLATKGLVAIRVLDGMFTLGAFLLVAALPGVCPPQARALIVPVGAVLVMLIGLLAWPDVVGRGVWRLFGPVVQRLEQWRVPGGARLRGYLERTMSITDVRTFRAALPSALLASLAVLVLVVLRFWASLNAVGANLSLLSAVYVASAMTILSALPIHGLAGFGPGDAAGAGLLMTISEPAHPNGFDPGTAIALQLGSHVLVALSTTIIGLIGSVGLQRQNGERSAISD